MKDEVDAVLKARIDHLQEIIDALLEVYASRDAIMALFEKKMELVELI